MGNLIARIIGWGHHTITPKLVDRETGKEIGEPEPFHGELELGMFYNDFLGRLWLWTHIVRAYFRYRGKVNGWLFNRPCSPQRIKKFAKEYKVNVGEAEKPIDQYRTINEFFTRRLKPGVRPVASPDDPSVAVSPADSRVLVFETVSEATSLWVKGEGFTIATLLTSRYDASRWHECSIIINRLAPVDYHRLHSPVTGVLKSVARAGKTLYAVEAAAINSSIDVYGRNERAILEFDTPAFGTVMFCVIGASQVGSCNVTAKVGQHVRKGEEVAYFAYGGSATITLFRQGAIRWDDDLLYNSRRLWETRVKVGQSIGSAIGKEE